MSEAELYKEYKGVYLSKSVHPPESLKCYEEFTFRPDDVLIVTYPKSGTTWMQEIVPLILRGGDPAAVESLPNWDRAPWLEQQNPGHQLDGRPSPRVFATHFHRNMMPLSFLEVRPKVVYVMRNPKDVFTSTFHYHRMAAFLVDPGAQNHFLRKFLDGKVLFGSWFDHVKSWLNYEDKDRILYISYEEMSKDLKDSVARIAQFLEKTLDDEVVAKIADSCVFENMRKNQMSNYSLVPQEFMDQTKSKFLRKGVTGDWKNQLTEAEAEVFDAVYRDKMKDVSFKFVWD